MSIDALNPILLSANHIGKGNMPTDVNTFGTRTTMWHELDIITWGDGVDNVFGHSYPVRAGDIFYRVPGLVNRHDLPYHCYFFVFDPYYDGAKEGEYKNAANMGYNNGGVFDAWSPIAPFSFATEPYLGKAADIDALAADAFQIFAEFHSINPDRFKLKIMFLKLLYNIANQLQQTKKNGGTSKFGHEHYRQRITDLCHIIENNPGRVYSLSEAAAYINLSPNFFCKIFKELMGQTFIQYVNRIKINYVKLLLLDSEMSIDKISDECGFCNATYLYSMFKHDTGMTPTQFREYRLTTSWNKLS